MNDIEIKYDNENFIFFIESWGQLTPEEIFNKALEIFDEKLDDFSEKLKKA